MPPRLRTRVNHEVTRLSTAVEATAEAFYRRYAYPDRLAHHSRLVGRIATVLAGRARGVDRRTVALAGYLHDVGRSPLLRDDPREHHELSLLALAAEGLADAGELALRHPVYAVLDEATRPRTLPERIVFYADRRGGMEILPMEARITETAERHPRYAAEIERSRPLAREIERGLSAELDLRPEDLAAEVAARWP
jgi:hypothetical protein